MKHITLLAAMAVSLGATAQRAPFAPLPQEVGTLPLSAARTATDTLTGPSLTPTASLAVYTLGGGTQYVVGTNQYDVAMAQKFEGTGSVYVEELLMLFAAKSGPGTVHVRVYGLDGPGFDEADTEVSNAPGSILGNVDLDMSQIDTGMTTLTFLSVPFSPPVQVSGDFAGGFDFSDVPSGSTLGMFSTSDGDNTAPNWNWEKITEGDWIAMGNTVQGWDFHADFAILAVIGDGVAGINDLGAVNNMRMSFLGSNPASNSVVVAYEMLQSADARLTVLDGKGAKVIDQQLGRTAVGQHQTTLDVSSFANGTYYVTLFANGTPLTKKLVVQH